MLKAIIDVFLKGVEIKRLQNIVRMYGSYQIISQLEEKLAIS
jgi:hypothetical protein